MLNAIYTNFMKFSKHKRNPPMVKSRKPQLTKPVKLVKPELHEKSESLGRCILENVKIRHEGIYLVFS